MAEVNCEKLYLPQQKAFIIFLMIAFHVSPLGSNNLHCRLHGQYFFILRKNAGTNDSPSAVAFDTARYYK